MDRDQLIVSARRTLNERPTASMAEIARRAGISRPTLHRHIESRDALLLEIAEDGLALWDGMLTRMRLEEVVASADPVAVREAVEQLVRGYVEMAETHGFAFTDPQLMNVPRLVERTQPIIDRELRLYARAQELGVVRHDLPAQWLSWSAFGMVVAARDAVNFGDIGRRVAPDLVAKTLFEGIGVKND